VEVDEGRIRVTALDLSFAADVLRPIALLTCAGSDPAAEAMERIERWLIDAVGAMAGAEIEQLGPAVQGLVVLSRRIAGPTPLRLDLMDEKVSPRLTPGEPSVREQMSEDEAVATLRNRLEAPVKGADSPGPYDEMETWNALNRAAEPYKVTGEALRCAQMMRDCAQRLSRFPESRRLGANLAFIWRAWVMPDPFRDIKARPTIVTNTSALATNLGLGTKDAFSHYAEAAKKAQELDERVGAFWALYDKVRGGLLELVPAQSAASSMPEMRVPGTLEDWRRSRLRVLKRIQGKVAMVGRSEAMLKVFATIDQVAQDDRPVLILGETGTGKELVAQAIHHCSARSEKAFVTVNCGGMTDTLLQSEFFGHKKGSFEGAEEDRAGKFLTADGGTIFLDEVGTASLRMQQMLLRTLESGEIQPVGRDVTVRVDVRVLVATNKNLVEKVANGEFQQDVLSRLNRVVIDLAPLRERPEDIPQLVEHFVEKVAKRHRRPRPKAIDQEWLTILAQQQWVGNIRELYAEVEQAVLNMDSKKFKWGGVTSEQWQAWRRWEDALGEINVNETPDGRALKAKLMEKVTECEKDLPAIVEHVWSLMTPEEREGKVFSQLTPEEDRDGRYHRSDVADRRLAKWEKMKPEERRSRVLRRFVRRLFKSTLDAWRESDDQGSDADRPVHLLIRERVFTKFVESHLQAEGTG